ncbi:hypothetical protein BSKO_14153 [Bryopsis sp. KO-2023]|nr:hypothetical protein BSKO_14153 [Bryopsis sp. KO-2023]
MIGGEMSTFEPMYDQSHGLQAQLTDCPRYLRTSENQLTIERSESYRMSCDPFRTRWKPNSVQLSILEEHFNSGYTKATPELHAAVQGAGLATESQVSVWLKNRLSRCRRAPMKMDKDAPTSDGEEKEDDKVQHLGFLCWKIGSCSGLKNSWIIGRNITA